MDSCLFDRFILTSLNDKNINVAIARFAARSGRISYF